MRYSIEPKDRTYAKGYGFLSFANKMSNKYSQKPICSAKKSTTDTIETASKREIHETAEATGDLIGNKTAHKITSISNKSSTELHSKKIDLQNEDETDIPKDLQRKRQQIIDELSLVQ